MRHRHQAIIYFIVLCLGASFLAAGYLNRQTTTLLVGNVLTLLATIFRWLTKIDNTVDSDVRWFYRAAYLLAPQTHVTEAIDHSCRRWSVKEISKLGALYWIDRGLILLFAFSALWLTVLTIQGIYQVPSTVANTILALVGSRIALRLVWVFRLIRQVGNGSYFAGVNLMDENLHADKNLEPHHDLEAHLNRIVSLLSEGKVKNAIEQSSLLIETESSLPGAYCIRGVSFRAAREYHKAIEDFDRAIELDSRYSHAFRCRGMAWMKLGNWDKARDDLFRSIQLAEGKESGAFVAIGNFHVAADEYDLAIEAYTRAIEIDNSPEAYVGRSEALIEMSHIRDAIENCNVLIAESQNDTAYALRAWGKMLIGEYSGALDDFKTAIDLSKYQSGSYAHYGYAWLLSTCPIESMRDGHLAFASATCVQDLARIEQWEVDRLLGAVCANQNQWGAAALHQRKALEFAPNWAIEKLDQQLRKYLIYEPIRIVEDNVGRVLPVFA